MSNLYGALELLFMNRNSSEHLVSEELGALPLTGN